MSTSRRSSKSTRSTATTRSNRPPAWRATSLISGNPPGLPLIISKNSSAPEVSVVTAEPETISGSGSKSAASHLAPTISKRSKPVSSSSVDGRLRAERKNSTRTRLQDVFPSEDPEEGGNITTLDSMPSGSIVSTDQGVAFPSTSSLALLESTALPTSIRTEATPVPNAPVHPVRELSSSPSRGPWLESLGRSKGKEKAADVDAITVSPNPVQDTPKPAAESLSVVAVDEGIDNAESLNSAIEALGSSQPNAYETMRAVSSPSSAEVRTLRAEISLNTKDPSKTLRGSEAPKHSWFNPFAPYSSRSHKTSSQPHPSHPPSPSPSPSTSPTSPSPLRRTSSSYVESIDDEVPGPVRTPAFSDDEDGQKVERTTNHLPSTLAPTSNGNAAGSQGESPPASAPMQTFQPRKRLDSLNSLNPSTSRFSISIPLLGRPKMRLEDAVKRGKEVDGEGIKESAPDIADASSTAAVSSVTTTPSISQPSLSFELPHTTNTLAITALTTAEGGRAEEPAELDMPVPSPIQPQSKGATDELPSLSSSVSQTHNEPDGVARTESSLVNALEVATPTQSWWSFIGWDTSQPIVTSKEPVPELRTEDNENSTPNPGITQIQPTDPLPERCTSAPPAMEPSSAPSVEPAESQMEQPQNSELTIPIRSQTENQAHAKAPSIFSLDAARAAGSWFNPWAWYGYGTVEPPSSDPIGSNTITNGGAEDSECRADDGNGSRIAGDGETDRTEMTESEKIKEAALARDRPPNTASSSAASPMTQNDTQIGSSTVVPEEKSSEPRPQNLDPINPIADSASSMHSGWASFFSLGRGRGLITKNLGDGTMEIEGPKDEVKRDENGMEIMDLTDDETGSMNVNVQEPEPEPERRDSEKAVSKVPASSALSLMRALAGQDLKRVKAIEGPKDEEKQMQQDVANINDKLPLLPPSPNPSMSSPKCNTDSPPVGLVPGSPSKAFTSRPGRASSVSTTQTSKSVGSKPAPPLTISDDLKASVAAAKKGKRAGVSPAVGPSSLPKDGISTPSPETDSLKKEKEKDKLKPANKSGTNTPFPPPPPPPNLVLPTWEDTFRTLPRKWVPEQYLPAANNTSGGLGTTIGKTMRYMSGMLLGADSGYTSGGESSRFGAGAGATKRRSRRGSSRRRSISEENAIPGGSEVGGEAELLARERQKLRELLNWGQNLPRAWEVIDQAIENRRKSVQDKKGKAKSMIGQEESHKDVDVTRGCKNVVVIGIHGWFPGAVMRSMLGEPTGTSPKFVNMMEQALENFQSAHGVQFDRVTKIPLEGEGTIDRRVEKLYSNLLANESWVDDLHNADVVFIATHSQGSVVSTHLIDRLIRDRHIRTMKNAASEPISDLGTNMVPLPPQRVCCLCLCGIHLGPLRYLSTSSLLQPYIQYFESAAARELFEFQNTESDVSKAYVQSLRNVLHNEVKMVYVASLNDQVVPIYSGLFTSASHPLILRALYIDGDAYHSSDFLTNLLVLLLRVLNCGLSDSGLLAHLSEATAGSLSGIGHSTAYEELSTFSLAVNYLFLANNGFEDHPELIVEHFNASHEMNDYEIPWALRDLIADEKVAHHFSREITQLRDAFREWHPKTTILRDIKRKLQPIQRLPTTSTPGTANNTSKL
ncbi:hypothetical protein DFJ43DRAFT_1084315 [Lentinula guzmanii]|uniref:YMC020W-like alpha/beta hydrolase domain-containing protein n=1 Tax=Lentinula guzmanii TaxID=2804957 RepID=A0AA38JFQ7_9AGAR|nr:hypothetical protein DFJ43DRAFT_1084315 [Lentinula guzmanii]